MGGFWVWNSWKNTFLSWFLLYWACFGTGFWYTSRQTFKTSRFVVIFVFWKSFKNVIYALLLMISIQKSCFGGLFSNYWKDCEKHLFKSLKKHFELFCELRWRIYKGKRFKFVCNCEMIKKHVFCFVFNLNYHRCLSFTSKFSQLVRRRYLKMGTWGKRTRKGSFQFKPSDKLCST